VVRYGYGGISHSHSRDAAGNVSHHVRDHLGTVRVVSSAEGDVLARHDFDAFGTPAGPSPAGIGFTGGYTDPATGFVFLRSRWYAPAMARFIHMDSADADPQDPRGLNRYVYSLDDPVNRFDLTGQVSITQLAVTIGIVGILANVFSPQWRSPTEALSTGLGFLPAIQSWDNHSARYVPGFPAHHTGGNFNQSALGGDHGRCRTAQFFNPRHLAGYIFGGAAFGLSLPDDFSSAGGPVSA
jgi:RHS repeat-associated protein